MHPSLVSLGVLHFVRGARVTRIGCGSDVAGIGCGSDVTRIGCGSDVARIGCGGHRMPRESDAARIPVVRNAGTSVTSGTGVVHPPLMSPGVLHFVRASDVAGRRSRASASGRIPPRESLPASAGRANGRPRESRAGEDASVQQSLGPGDGASECAPPAGARADVDAHAELGGSVR